MDYNNIKLLAIFYHMTKDWKLQEVEFLTKEYGIILATIEAYIFDIQRLLLDFIF